EHYRLPACGPGLLEGQSPAARGHRSAHDLDHARTVPNPTRGDRGHPHRDNRATTGKTGERSQRRGRAMTTAGDAVAELYRDVERCAESAGLAYVEDCLPGMTRTRRGKG